MIADRCSSSVQSLVKVSYNRCIKLVVKYYVNLSSVTLKLLSVLIVTPIHLIPAYFIA